jgi:hypothetical protein
MSIAMAITIHFFDFILMNVEYCRVQRLEYMPCAKAHVLNSVESLLWKNYRLEISGGFTQRR